MRRGRVGGPLLALVLLAFLAGCGQASARVDRLYAGAPAGGTSGDVAWLFPRGGGDAAARVAGEIGAARATLDVAVYSFTDERIAQAVLAAERRGVRVRLITDREELRNPYQKAVVRELLRAGVPVEENRHSGLMHLKVAVVDGRTVITGSYNWTLSAAGENDENLLVIRDPVVAASYERLFQSMWTDRRDFGAVSP